LHFFLYSLTVKKKITRYSFNKYTFMIHRESKGSDSN
jgi:hypothetical protein